MKQTAELLCFVLLLLAALSLGNCKSLNSHRKYQVQISNGLEDDILQAQCTAEGEELTNADLSPNQEHSWSFKKRDVGPTQIWCYLLWTKGRRSFLSFPEDPTSMNEYCANVGCEWRAQKNGIFLLNKKTGAYEHRYDWDKKLDP